MELLRHNVVVGIGCKYTWEARNLPFDIAWVGHHFRSLGSNFLCLALGCN